MSAPVFVISPDQVIDVGIGDVVRLDGDEGRHAAVVQRIAVGEQVELVDGQGTRIHSTVAAAGKGWLECTVVGIENEPPEQINFVLVQALAKSDRSELAIQTATELGVMRVVPWQATRSIVQWRGDRLRKSHDKWQQATLAASKQARRAWHPDVSAMVDTAGLTQVIDQASRDGDTVLVLHESATAGLAATAGAALNSERFDERVSTRIWLIVGPEGGVTDEELTAFTAAGASVVRLGPHVLRTSSAGPAAIAALQVLCGAWN